MITCEFENGNKAGLRHVVVDNLVLKDNNILLVKRAPRLLEGGKWALVGGFVDRDETILEAVAREVLEETGYSVRDITLLRIVDRPDRPNDANRQNISFVHICYAVEKIGTPDNESTMQEWFSLTDLPPKEAFAFDHYENVEAYLDSLKQTVVLPKVG